VLHSAVPVLSAASAAMVANVTSLSDAVTGGLCNRVLVSALVSDSSGLVVGQYQDAVSYTKASTTGSKWNLIGNGKKLELAIYPSAFLDLADDGTLGTATSPNLGVGIQTHLQAQSDASVPVKLLDSATLQTPGGISIPLAVAGLTLATGFVPLSHVLWLGAQDAAGRRYFSSYTLTP
jgi:hypothetical protein